MKNKKQTQKAGADSTQIQVEKIEYHYGMNLQEVTQIIKNEIDRALKENALVAEAKARNRLNEFSEILLPKLVKANIIECFCEPAVQVFFRSLEKTVICTDSHSCYELLSEMLIHRVNKNEDYTTVAATNKAIEVADKISDDALLFLTVFLCVEGFIPNSGNIKEGLQVLDNLYGNILGNKEIPYNNKIVDNLEIVGAIRRQSFLEYKSFDEFFFEELEGYFCIGIDKQSENYQKAKKLLEKIGVEEKIIFSDSLIENHIRINVVNKNKIGTVKLSVQQDIVNSTLNEIYDLYDKLPENINNAKNNFNRLIDSYSNIKKVKNWWDTNIKSCGVSITPVGRVLAHTNAKRFDNNIPNLD